MYDNEEEMQPTIGRIVYYQLTKDDVEQILLRRGIMPHVYNRTTGTSIYDRILFGNPVHEGEIVPMIIVQIFPNEYGPDFAGVNGQCLLDGNDSFWVTSKKEGEEPGQWSWPPRV